MLLCICPFTFSSIYSSTNSKIAYNYNAFNLFFRLLQALKSK